MHWNSSLTSFATLRLGLYVVAALTAVVLLASLPPRRGAEAQEAATPVEAAGPSSEPIPPAAAAPAAPTIAKPKDTSINIFALAIAGGIFMIPIAGMSILAVTMTIERILGLRAERVLPDGLVTGLGELAAQSGSFDPRKAYRLCQQFPSAAASVVRALLLKVGRPLPEIESAAAQTSQREADRLYSNVRWLNLAASLSTMLGLIGTIQGMILAFHRLTNIDASADRTSVLADGIYTALVTTFAGLAVAIPALFASHFFENRILSFFRQIDELVASLLPQLERYEGRVRFSRQAENGNGDGALAESAADVGTDAR
jgi:biopolymer transport protein ExbB